MKKEEFKKWQKVVDSLLEELRLDGVKHGATATQIAQGLSIMKPKLINHLFKGEVSPEKWQEAEEKFGEGFSVDIPITKSDKELKDIERLREDLVREKSERQMARVSDEGVLRKVGKIIGGFKGKIEDLEEEVKLSPEDKELKKLDKEAWDYSSRRIIDEFMKKLKK